MKKRTPKFSLLVLVLTTINLCFSVSISNAVDVVGSISLNECTGSTCLTLNVPETLSLSAPQFLNPDGDQVLVIFNYPLQALEVSDSRSSGGFKVFLEITPLMHSTNPTAQIDIPNISVLSFNSNSDESISTDNGYNDPSVISYIDPDLDQPDGHNLTRENIETNYKTNPDWFYRFPLNAGGLILEAPFKAVPGYRDTFKTGLAFVIDTPLSPEQTLLDGNYTLSIKYTLTTP